MSRCSIEDRGNPAIDEGIVEGRSEQLSSLYKIYDEVLVRGGGWDKFLVYTQPGGLNVYGYRNTTDKLDYVGLGTIHGSEEIGALAWAECSKTLVEMNKPMLLLPFNNPWGFLRGERYGQSGKSVGDTDDFFGYSTANRTPQSEKLIRFILSQKFKVRRHSNGLVDRTKVLDIHEDGLWEDSLIDLPVQERRAAVKGIYKGVEYKGDGSGKYIDSGYSYLYAASRGSTGDPLVGRMVALLEKNGNPLPKSAHTRFPGEKVEDGVVWNAEDGSIDQLMAYLEASTITTEITRRSPFEPTFAYRSQLQRLLIRTFFEME